MARRDLMYSSHLYPCGQEITTAVRHVTWLRLDEKVGDEALEVSIFLQFRMISDAGFLGETRWLHRNASHTGWYTEQSTLSQAISIIHITNHCTTASHIALTRTLVQITGKKTSARCVWYKYTNIPQREQLFNLKGLCASLKQTIPFIRPSLKIQPIWPSSQKELTGSGVLAHFILVWDQDFDSLTHNILFWRWTLNGLDTEGTVPLLKVNFDWQTVKPYR